MSEASIKQKPVTGTIFDFLPTPSELAHKGAIVRGESEESALKTAHAFSVFDYNPLGLIIGDKS